MNNFKKIKQMKIDEMAEWLKLQTGCDGCPAYEKECILSCQKYIKQWLLQEVEE